jgi:signal transduction histidine kinase
MIEILNSVCGDLSLTQRVAAYEHVREIHRLFESRVQEVCGWFIRPVFRRDRYDLRTLIDSTVSIIRELDVSFDFQELIVVDDDIDINRGSFEIIGDILFVLVGNAAKHGRRGGSVTISAERLSTDDRFVRLAVSSQTEDELSYVQAQDRIREAYSINKSMLNSAAVDEGFSGIRKIMGLINKTRSEFSRLDILKIDSECSIIFDVVVPTGVSFKRGRV